MSNRKVISLDEKKTIQLDMLKEIDDFCRANGIRYSLAFGTLIGAIRHKGFIPWDDDVDIMMPLPDMLRFKKMFHSETLKYCDIDTELHYNCIFSRIADVRTYDKVGIFSKSYGVHIDLYPIVAVPDNEEDRQRYYRLAELLQNRYLCVKKWRSRVLHYLPVSGIPVFDTCFYDKSIKRCIKHLMYSCDYGSTDHYYAIATYIRLHDKMTYDAELFSDLIDVDFENLKLYSIANFDKFLSLMYGDYMTPPPIEKRVPYHGGNFYWR